MDMVEINAKIEEIRRRREGRKPFVDACRRDLEQKRQRDEIKAAIKAFEKRRAARLAARADDFDPNQPRDPDGEFACKPQGATEKNTEAESKENNMAEGESPESTEGTEGIKSTEGTENGNNKSIDKRKKKPKIKLTGKQKIIADALKKAKTEPPNYFELSGRNPNFPCNWKAKIFSHSSTLKDHNDRHGNGVGAKDEADYVEKAKAFLHSPLGESGDAFVGTDGRVYKYDYKTKIFAIADSKGTIDTYWNLGADKGLKGADEQWLKFVKKYKEV